jgi:hypothetical protein
MGIMKKESKILDINKGTNQAVVYHDNHYFIINLKRLQDVLTNGQSDYIGVYGGLLSSFGEETHMFNSIHSESIYGAIVKKLFIERMLNVLDNDE